MFNPRNLVFITDEQGATDVVLWDQGALVYTSGRQGRVHLRSPPSGPCAAVVGGDETSAHRTVQVVVQEERAETSVGALTLQGVYLDKRRSDTLPSRAVA